MKSKDRIWTKNDGDLFYLIFRHEKREEGEKYSLKWSQARGF